jgi:hypothetical protein
MEEKQSALHAKFLRTKFLRKASKWIDGESPRYFTFTETPQNPSVWKRQSNWPKSNPELRLNHVVCCAFEGKTDYMPMLYVLLGGNLDDNCFHPFAMEYGTLLKRNVPVHFRMKNEEIISEPDPLSALVLADKRLTQFLQALSSKHSYHKGRGTTPCEITHDNFAEAFNFGNSALVGFSFIPRIKSGKPISVEDSGDGTRAYTMDYDFEPIVFEIFGRLAYYANYVASTRGSGSSMEQSQLILPHLIDEGN